VTNHFPITGDKLCKHNNHQKNLKGMSTQQIHGTNQVMVNEEKPYFFLITYEFTITQEDFWCNERTNLQYNIRKKNQELTIKR